jgi:hypothetical protein
MEQKARSPLATEQSIQPKVVLLIMQRPMNWDGIQSAVRALAPTEKSCSDSYRSEQEQILEKLLAERNLNRPKLAEVNLVELMDRQHKDTPAKRDRGQLRQMNNARHKIFKQVLKQIPKDRELNQLNSRGQTLLHVAAQEGRSRCLESLLRRGADMKITSRESQTLLDIIRAYGSHPTCSYERNMYQWNVYDLHLLSQANPEDIFFCHADPSSSEQNGRTVSFRLKELADAEEYLNRISTTLSQSKLHWFHIPSTNVSTGPTCKLVN